MQPGEASAQRLREEQLRRLQALLSRILPANGFYARKFGPLGPTSEISDWQLYKKLPFTTKDELVKDQLDAPPYGTNLTFPFEHYARFHQTSGTTGKPIRWLDTNESWSALIDNWVEVFETAGVTPRDRIYFAFSFGPFLGFWLAFEAGCRLGALSLPGGGLTSEGRLDAIFENNATVLCCTPTYAIHLAEVARQRQRSLTRSPVRLLVVAGEAGGSLPATRKLLESLWPGARIYDHHGMTETGPITYECPARPGRLHVIDRSYIAEVLGPGSNEAVVAGSEGELVITNLHRPGSPLIRYRTGDLVRLAAHHATDAACECGRYETALEGGILGRTDDMVVVRGVNIYPTAIEQIVREFPEVAEYQVHLSRKGALSQLHLVIEPVATLHHPTELVVRLERALHSALALRIPVVPASSSLPRAELKSRRWIVDG